MDSMRALKVAACSLAMSCSGPEGPSRASPVQLPSGFIQVALRDRPISGHEVTAVNVCIERVDLVFNGGRPHETLAVSRTINLLELSNGVTAQLGVERFPIGRIQQVRLILCPGGATAVVDGIAQPVRIPSGEHTGIKLTFPGGFEIRENVTTTIVLDFDVDASLHFGDGWILTPVVQIVEDAIILAVTSPVPDGVVRPEIAVLGTVASREPLASLVVNGVPADVRGVDWRAEVVLPRGHCDNHGSGARRLG